LRPIVFFHNTTPPKYVAPFHSDLACALSRGREEIRLLAEYPAITPSAFSRRELLALGFDEVYVVPLLIDFDRLRRSAESSGGQIVVSKHRDDASVWLAVGRIAPNKCYEDILKAFAYYHHIIDSRSCLLFVGGWRHFEAYQFNLGRLVEKLSIDDAVEWCGWVAYDEGFAAYYEAASVLISMSEHEGFCLPLIEAMVFDLPVVAYAGAAIPDTLGDAGVLVHQKHYESIAWLVRALDTDPTLRQRLIDGQRKRLKNYVSDRVVANLRAVFAQYLSNLA
jgi:glycosyltransferase involved in cell wall biosynthesis